jgi:outer membrane immunogenic protein
MKFRLTGLLVTAIGIVTSQTAFAADMPVKAPVYKAPRSVVASDIWSGFYFGGHLGGAWGHNRFSDPVGGLTAAGEFAGDRGSAFIGGPQLGANWQTGNYVFGIQADIAFANLKTSAAAPLFPTTVMNTRTENITTVTGRVGYAWDMLLLYVKGGGAWAHNKYQELDVTFPFNATGSATQSGYVVGAGWEWAFAPNWSVFVEYDYIGLGTKSNVPLTDPVFGTGPVDVKQDIQMVKTGVNFKLAPWWPGMGALARR